jgi:hypothetical protein
MSQNISTLQPNDPYLYEKLIASSDDQTVFSSFRPVIQTGAGIAAGVAIGIFFLPTTSLIACGLVGGLGLYSASNMIQSFWSKHNLTPTLTIPTSKQFD